MGIFTNNRTGSSVDELKYNFDQGARGNRFDVQFFLPEPFGKKTDAYQTSETKLVRRKNPDGSFVEATQTAESVYNGPGGTDEIIVTAKRTHDEVTTVTDHPARWDASQMGLRVESCTLPGRSVDTTTFSEYGAERTLPTGTVNDGGTIDFTFICDQSFADRLIIEAWQSIIFASGTGTSEMPKLAWYDDYIGRVKIIQHRLDRKGSEDTKRNALEYTLHEAYPVEFAEQTLSMGSEGEGIMKFSCTVAYRYWESKYIPAPERSLLNRGRGLLDALLEGSNLLSRFGVEGKFRDKLTNLDTRTTEIKNLFG